jgi:hypothetical protein
MSLALDVVMPGLQPTDLVALAVVVGWEIAQDRQALERHANWPLALLRSCPRVPLLCAHAGFIDALGSFEAAECALARIPSRSASPVAGGGTLLRSDRK